MLDCRNPDTSHGYASKRFPLTAAQGRVLFHAERILRSAGGPGVLAAADWRAACARHALPVLVAEWTRAQCYIGAALLTAAARHHRMHLFRDVSAPLEGA